ncbi:hypothetical protein FOQG_08089 [Fusarium oxysporum f. sp. raphani 54005]|uniref:Uncharacterized protein n=2 Tax=Fusarium oxysporum TaxID=5507 RepID=X0CDA2_FUSOX|nr:hypothetical protein FOVG_05774 [Fusarium oxysporum f. sp. pisi HDV247]EXK88799.1 hypothetical protein FOQG_08089 [Fusarium oxysporum f. sp. raphani 54005]
MAKPLYVILLQMCQQRLTASNLIVRPYLSYTANKSQGVLELFI